MRADSMSTVCLKCSGCVLCKAESKHEDKDEAVAKIAPPLHHAAAASAAWCCVVSCRGAAVLGAQLQRSCSLGTPVRTHTQ